MKPFFLLAVVFIGVNACSSDTMNQERHVGDSSWQAEQVFADKSAMNANDARVLANKHLQQKGIQWGAPSSVREKNSSYVVQYETAQDEKRIIGARQVIIDKRTGSVLVPRRR